MFYENHRGIFGGNSILKISSDVFYNFVPELKITIQKEHINATTANENADHGDRDGRQVSIQAGDLAVP